LLPRFFFFFFFFFFFLLFFFLALSDVSSVAGIPDHRNLRPLCWRVSPALRISGLIPVIPFHSIPFSFFSFLQQVLLNLLPLERSQWETSLRKNRDLYYQFVDEMVTGEPATAEDDHVSCLFPHTIHFFFLSSFSSFHFGTLMYLVATERQR
jgi:hypothetical protein